MKNNITELMQQARKLQQDMEKAQKELENMEVIGEAGGGLVKVGMNGRHIVKWVKLDPSILSEDQAVIEDLIAAAFNDAVRKIERGSKAKMAELASQLGLPGGAGGDE
jgi:DNA-binding YbaB/EbfC family protein